MCFPLEIIPNANSGLQKSCLGLTRPKVYRFGLRDKQKETKEKKREKRKKKEKRKEKKE